MKKIALVCFLSLLAGVARADLYLSPAVSVSAESDDAVVAKDEALKQAVEQAFPLVLQKVATGTVPADIVMPEDLSAYVRSLSVDNEKNTGTRYLADVQVQFNAKEIQKFLKANNIEYLQKMPPKILILPIFKEGETVSVFGTDNPLFVALKNQLPTKGAHDFIVPLGDETDMMNVTDDVILGENYDSLRGLLDRYKANQMAIITVTKNQNAYRVVSVSYPENTAAGVDLGFAVSSVATNTVAVMSQIMDKAAVKMEEQWKQNQVTHLGQQEEMIVVFPIGSLAERVQVEKKLKNMSFLDEVVVSAFYQNQVAVRLVFSESADSILSKMQRSGLSLQNAGSFYVWQKQGVE